MNVTIIRLRRKARVLYIIAILTAGRDRGNMVIVTTTTDGTTITTQENKTDQIDTTLFEGEAEIETKVIAAIDSSAFLNQWKIRDGIRSHLFLTLGQELSNPFAVTFGIEVNNKSFYLGCCF